MHIPSEVVEDIKTWVNIDEIISSYVKLRKKGENYLGLCPFHDEKTPSFVVSPARQIYHCFGCHTGGNVYKFLMDYEKISFPEAVIAVAKKAGLENLLVNISDKSYTNENLKELELLYDINFEASRFFAQELQKNEHALKYLESRGITENLIKTFMIGYAPNDRRYIEDIPNLRVKNMSEELQEIGLLKINREGQEYPRFLDRIMFPIMSTHGRIVSFAGRRLNEDTNEAKYLNGPESNIFRKSAELYGLSHTKDLILKSDEVIIVEGYTDVILAYAKGLPVVGQMGTALTDIHVKLLARYAQNKTITQWLDPDKAGITAAIRSFAALMSNEKITNTRAILNTEEEGDPADFLKTHDIKEFYAKKRLDFTEFLIKVKNPESVDEKLKIVEDVIKYSDNVPLSSKISQVTNLWEKLNLPLEGLAERVTEQIEKNNLDEKNLPILGVNNLRLASAEYVRILLGSDPEFIEQYVNLLPPEKIPEDGSIMSEPLLEVYKLISNQIGTGENKLGLPLRTLRKPVAKKQKKKTQLSLEIEDDYDKETPKHTLENYYNNIYKSMSDLIKSLKENSIKYFPSELAYSIANPKNNNILQLSSILLLAANEKQIAKLSMDKYNALLNKDLTTAEEIETKIQKLLN